MRSCSVEIADSENAVFAVLDAQCKTNPMVGEEEPTEKVEIFLKSCMPYLHVSLNKSLKLLISALHTGCVRMRKRTLQLGVFWTRYGANQCQAYLTGSPNL